ncbi:MAG TPA: diaminopimelate decarboxylase [Terriglobales bacterium]|nr:diaminopimelate decarboxylase [Terriglobales bacterium]
MAKSKSQSAAKRTPTLPVVLRSPGFAYRRTASRRDKSAAGETALHCERVPLSSLADEFSTPLYAYSAAAIRRRYRDFDRAFRGSPHTVCYSVKANSNLAILRLLAELGCGFDVVSGGELERVLQADRRAARKVVFSGVGKTAAEMDAALKAGILLFNLESEGELELLAERSERRRVTARVALRVNPDVPADTHPYISTGLHRHKFGVPIHDAPRLYARAADSLFLEVAGVSVHIGSQITNLAPFTAAMERVADLVRGLRADGHTIRYVDAGGGLGISYTQPGLPLFADFTAHYAAALSTPLRGLKLHLLLEPGRSIVGPAGVLLTRVLYHKSNNSKRFLVVDAAMNDLVRPALYDAYHEIVPVLRRPASEHELFDVVGPICETGDFFARGREMPPVKDGDLLAILDAGAYGMVLASNYNTRPRPAEVLVDGGKARLIRHREKLSDLLRLEKV